jgi:hypothetical protein
MRTPPDVLSGSHPNRKPAHQCDRPKRFAECHKNLTGRFNPKRPIYRLGRSPDFTQSPSGGAFLCGLIRGPRHATGGGPSVRKWPSVGANFSSVTTFPRAISQRFLHATRHRSQIAHVGGNRPGHRDSSPSSPLGLQPDGDQSRASSDIGWRRLDWLAGHIGLELRNVVAKYRFEKSRRFPGSSRILATETIRV